MISPKHLAQLAVIVETGSIVRAAQALNLTQPTLSRTVKVIEDRVGSPVLMRGRHGVTPTSIGLLLIEDGNAILRRARQAQKTIDVWKLGLSGELRVGVGAMLATTIMGDFLARSVQQDWPYSMQVRVEGAVPFLEELGDGEIDIVIAVVAPHKVHQNQEHLEYSLIQTSPMAVFGSVNDPLTTSEHPIEASALEDRMWIDIAASSGFEDSLRSVLLGLGIGHVVPRFSFDRDISMAATIAARENGFLLLPELVAPALRTNFGLTPVRLAQKMPTRDLAVWTKRADTIRPEIVHFREQLDSYLSSIQS